MTNATFVGDPQAKIYSFGKLANGNMGNVGGDNVSDLSATTAATDLAHWKSLGRNEVENASKIDAADAIVDAVAGSVREDRPYALTPNPGEVNYRDGGRATPEVNSNSAAFAIGDKSEQTASGDPNARIDRKPFTLTLPGALAGDKVQFDNKVFCTGSRIALDSC